MSKTAAERAVGTAAPKPARGGAPRRVRAGTRDDVDAGVDARRSQSDAARRGADVVMTRCDARRGETRRSCFAFPVT